MITKGKIGWAAPAATSRASRAAQFTDESVERDGPLFQAEGAYSFRERGGYQHKVRTAMIGRIYSSGKISGAWGVSVRVYRHDRLITRCQGRRQLPRP